MPNKNNPNPDLTDATLTNIDNLGKQTLTNIDNLGKHTLTNIDYLGKQNLTDDNLDNKISQILTI